MLKKLAASELAKMLYVAFPMILQPCLSFLYLIVVANTNSVEMYGILSFLIVISATVISFSDLGLRDFLVSSRGQGSGISTVRHLLLPSLLVTFLLLASLSQYLLFFDKDLSFLLFLFFIPEIMAFGIFYKCIFFIYQKKSCLEVFSKKDGVYKSVVFGIKIAVVVISGSVYYSILAGSVFAFFLYGLWLKKEMGGTNRGGFDFCRIKKEISEVCGVWRQWLPFSVSFFSFFLYFNSDRFIVEAVLGEYSLAIYAAGYSFIAVGQILVSVIWSLYMPQISRGVEVFNKKSFGLSIFFITLMLVISYQVFSWFFFDYFYPSEYEQSKIVLSILSLFFLFRMPNVVHEMYWVANDKVEPFVRMRILAGIGNVVLNLIFVPFLGVIFAAITTVLSEAVLSFYIYRSESLESRKKPTCN